MSTEGFASSPVLNPYAHQVYRLRSWTGLLLYVGATNDVDRRLAEHARKTPWYRLARKVEVERFPGRDAAFAAERTAIRTEHPLFNRVGYHDETTYEVETLNPGAVDDTDVGDALDFIFGQVFGSVDG